MPGTPSVSNITTKSTTLTSLTGGSVYTVWVKAVNEKGAAVSDPWVTAVYDPAPLADLAGTWLSVWYEEYTIANGEFISAMGGSLGYKGTIVNIRTDDSDSEDGYITIRYTENNTIPGNVNVVGNYYVIRWEDWVSSSTSTITISGADNVEAGGKGYNTITAAEAGYAGTIGAEPFLGGSDCGLMTEQSSHPSAIQGSWEYGTSSGSDLESYTITDKLVLYSIMGASTFAGEIVNVRALEEDENYITFKFLAHANPNLSLVGKYSVLYWTDFTANTSVDMGAALDSMYPGDCGEDTKEAAEAEYTLSSTNSDDCGYFENYDLEEIITFTPPSLE
jgi:hypothetical protein